MTDSSHAAEMLKLARRVLRDDFLKQISPEDKYQALMVANAMAIAARQLECDELVPSDEDMSRLCLDIRAGDVSPGSLRYEETYEVLLLQARQKVLISNPGYLDE
jgi:hypothetical protein